MTPPLRALLAFAAPLAAFAGEAPDLPAFDDFVERFGLSYNDSELPARKQAYKERLDAIAAHNADQHRSWTAGISEMSAATGAELTRMRGRGRGLRRRKAGGLRTAAVAAPSLRGSKETRPSSVDWRTHMPSVVTPVKHQGHCGSCWAFAATQVVETHIAIKTGILMDLSPQQLVSCAPPPEGYDEGGCEGSFADVGLDYVLKTGINTQWRYPYISGITKTTGRCILRNLTSKTKSLAGITGYVNLPANAGEAMMAALAKHGPLVASANAPVSWDFYASGIFNSCDKKVIPVDHAVVLMGYGQETGADGRLKYWWLVRNSWGATWGEHGYIRLERHPEGEPCGDDEGERVCGECGILSDGAYVTGGFLRHAERPPR